MLGIAVYVCSGKLCSCFVQCVSASGAWVFILFFYKEAKLQKTYDFNVQTYQIRQMALTLIFKSLTELFCVQILGDKYRGQEIDDLSKSLS